jgi:hypothetical protein
VNRPSLARLPAQIKPGIEPTLSALRSGTTILRRATRSIREVRRSAPGRAFRAAHPANESVPQSVLVPKTARNRSHTVDWQ